MKEKPKVLGLGLELATIIAALEAAHLLLLGEIDTPAEWTPRAGAAAILSLTTTRLELLRAVMRGELDPAFAIAEHNASLAEADDGDVRLTAWTPKEAESRLNEQLARARRRLKRP